MNTKGHCYPKYVILQAVYFKLRFTLSYRDVEEIMKIRGVIVDHATIQRWVYKFAPSLEAEMKKRKGRVGTSWRLDETYIKVKGIWCYLHRAVDRSGNTVDFLLTKRRQRMSAQSFLIKAISNNCSPRVINIDKSGSNTAAIKVYNKRSFSKIKIRQCKYLNNIVEQDHRFIKWRIQNGLGFKSFESAKRTLSGIEVVHMLRKNQMIRPELSMFKSFCKLAG
ncbi:IS6 family transposase [Flavobacterium ginsenosidimutans]|uniref:IS6 family transposase n=1 Tax=Flavobacterium ginsenosidimutans TaxID=687844 RepID=UPI000DAC8E87|nr:IS6 family transposase [Flavobacterium ginsenosidimutans]KAF2328063.1 IS6 family transposase [Flavobacterium ginsenosidimutans]